MYIIPQSFPSLMPECWITLSATGWTLSPRRAAGTVAIAARGEEESHHDGDVCSGRLFRCRWFFNNDDLIKKTPDYHITINMASVRCDGLESAASFADAYNFYPTDGMTLFQRSGDEYFRIMGGWDVTASPGVTAREGMDKLVT